MATCRECLHIDICSYKNYQDAVATGKDKEVFITIRNNMACRFFTPKSEYVKRERGEWKKWGCGLLLCSNCGYEYDKAGMPNEGLNYCPICGVDMRKED